MTLFIPRDNRPAPLAAAPIPLLADELCQMSFGERAALEGILGQLKPRVSIEIGTYEGGSLRRVAAHSTHVHALDLEDMVPDRTPFPNVSFHIGDSKAVLPQLLRQLDAEGRSVDFVLIDGDHSAEGVRQDLVNVLDAPAAARAVILLHDTRNQLTRAGIEAAALADHPRVVYFDLDLVPGYTFRGGHFDGESWGGLGLVITGDRRSEGYLDRPRQARYADPLELENRAISLQDQLDQAAEQLSVSQHWLGEIQTSLSWRITAPLRSLKRRLTRTRS